MDQVRHGNDGTLSRKTFQYMEHLVSEYDLTKAKKHPRFRFVTDFYKAHNLKRQNFLKYYHRYKIKKVPASLLPKKRGPRYKTNRTCGFVEKKVIELRKEGRSRYDIFGELSEILKKSTPAPSTIYNIFKRHEMNRLKPAMKKSQRKIIKKKAGELGHIDCHYLPTGLIENSSKRYYVVAIVDSCTRVAWAQVVENIKAITVMFAVLKSLNLLKSRYDIQFSEILTDNGSEFGSGKDKKNKDTHPFEVMLNEMGIKHRYTRPYRPQTNGKVERFWRTLNDDLIEDVVFDSLEHLKDELQQYMLYYNELRPHQGIDGKTPAEQRKNVD